MSFIADGHIHIYPNFNLNDLIQHAQINLKSHGTAQSYVLYAVEPEGQFEFDKIKDFSPTDDPNVIQSGNLYLVAGRQVVSKERLEFLALFCKQSIPDGLNVNELAQAVKKASGILVLNWAPGKWMFKRSRLVREILEKFGPKELLICDTALRFVPEPSLMKLARKKGFKIIAGSDPFPFKGEEFRVGKYGFICEGTGNFKKALFENDLVIVGRRLLIHQALWRVFKIMLKKTLTRCK